jgi:hypothetical protein
MSRNVDFRTEYYRPYAQALGEIALVWNDFHVTLSDLFWAVSKVPNGLMPDAIWNSLKSDRSQREALKSLVELKIDGHNLSLETREEILWVLKKADSLEDLRNDALHAPMYNSESGMVFAWHHLGNKRAKKLEGKNLIAEYNWFYETTLVLREYTQKLSGNLRFPSDPVPARPKLSSR